MRISDWSSDVCSSDLFGAHRLRISPQDRQDAIVKLRLGGMSTRAISAVVGVDQSTRSEERRVGKECVRTCRSRRSPYHYKKKEEYLNQLDTALHDNSHQEEYATHKYTYSHTTN